MVDPIDSYRAAVLAARSDRPPAVSPAPIATPGPGPAPGTVRAAATVDPGNAGLDQARSGALSGAADVAHLLTGDMDAGNVQRIADELFGGDDPSVADAEEAANALDFSFGLLGDSLSELQKRQRQSIELWASGNLTPGERAALLAEMNQRVVIMGILEEQMRINRILMRMILSFAASGTIPESLLREAEAAGLSVTGGRSKTHEAAADARADGAARFRLEQARRPVANDIDIAEHDEETRRVKTASGGAVPTPII